MSHRTSTLVASGRQHLVPTYRQRELVLERGEGSRLWDIEGREYVDFAAGIAVSALGHGDADILAALAEQAGFKLVAQSEINANPKDTKDYPGGVWTLPPVLREGDSNREKYLAIGESDRMTLKFVKP